VQYPRPAWVEQDPLEVWRSVRAGIEECLATAPGIRPGAVAIANQRESILLWERSTGAPAGPCVIWQCQRGVDFCEALRACGLEQEVRERTGLTVDPMFSASKARWLLENTPHGFARAADGELRLGTVDSWLLWQLTGGAEHACDYTNASRTQLLNLARLNWDSELLDLFGIPLAALPSLHASSHVFGATIPLGRLPGGVPIAALIGDSHAALFGHAGFEQGDVKATYGTGSSLMTPIEAPVISERGLSTTVAWALADGLARYALEGNIYATGAAVQWLGEFLGAADPGAQIELLAGRVADSAGVYLVPAFTGLGAPHWNDAARGLLSGVTRGTTAAHAARAALEAIAFQVRDVFDLMAAESAAKPQALLADGGGSRDDLLMQIQADILGIPVLRSLSQDVSALGAAYLAGLATGVWSSTAEIAALPRGRDRFEPQMSPTMRDDLYAGWQNAVRRACFIP
jgi:glycerol kinase